MDSFNADAGAGSMLLWSISDDSDSELPSVSEQLSESLAEKPASEQAGQPQDTVGGSADRPVENQMMMLARVIRTALF